MRKIENKEEVLEMAKMRIDGYSFQEIADKYGVTRQCVQQKLAYSLGMKNIEDDSKIVYPNIKEWMRSENISKFKLSKMVGMKQKTSSSIRQKLYGEVEFKISEIKRLIEITGMPFEVLFSEEKKDE